MLHKKRLTFRPSFAWILASLGVLCYGICAVAPTQDVQASTTPPIKESIDFNRDIKPILSEHCFPCHGPDSEATEATGGLRLDSFEGATEDRNGRQAIVPGDIENSWMMKRVKPAVPALQMPPPYSNVKPLNDKQKDLLEAWIKSGAEYKKHWAFISPTRPTKPHVSDPFWTTNEIDYYILAKLDEAGLQPNKQADKRTLIRRVALTLTGLLPTLDEINTYLSDNAAGSYERMVDRYLASPRYGEHQARYWLDAVRYADTHGLHIDNERASHPYRDWVVRAFNEDLPFDKFAVYQLAGDLLPKPTLDQKIATGYIRMNPTTSEGGVIVDEVLARNTFDRAETSSTVFLGLTMGCARCHDHRYDPLPQKDYFRFYAFFNSTTDNPLDGNRADHQPVIKAPSPEQQEQLEDYNDRIIALLKRTNPSDARAWVKNTKVNPPQVNTWEVSGPYPAENFKMAFDQKFAPEPGAAGKAEWRASKFKTSEVLAGVVGRDNAAAYLKTTVHAESSGEFDFRLGSDDGIKVWVNGKLVHQNPAQRGVAPDQDVIKVSLSAGTNAILVKIVNGGGADGAFFAIGDALSEKLAEVSKTLNSSKPEHIEQLKTLYLESGPLSQQAKQYRNTKEALADLEESIPITMVAEEMEEPRETFVLRRGEYDQPLEKVTRGIPVVLGELPKNLPLNRLGLAKWIVDEKNPIVSRVFVNRIWQQHFGTGLVKTSENFGNQGEWPSHPQLLNYLSVEFIEDGWSIKNLHKQILMSSAFRQFAGADQERLAKDPENRLISRGPRFRLDAEVIRDQALQLSGLMVDMRGGRGVHPYQPPGLWKAVAYPSSNTANYMQDSGDALYRRSIYTFWKRTSPPPMLTTFDAPTREACTVRRSRTNTPLQALATLNDPQFVEAARVFATRVYSSANDDQTRLALAFEMATARTATDKELSILINSLEAQRSGFAHNAQGVNSLLEVGEFPLTEEIEPAELAAWTMVCSMILNLDEVLTQH